MINEISRKLKPTDDVAFLILYPDRYYTSQQSQFFFGAISRESPHPIIIHGKPRQNASGGYIDYGPDEINRLAEFKNIIGMKEECSTYEEAFKVISRVDNDFGIIVAGGSQRRHSFLGQVGANTFLSGLGSINPEVDLYYDHCYNTGLFDECQRIVREYETPFFRASFHHGWHSALQYYLKELGIYNGHGRHPFPSKGGKSAIMDGTYLGLKETLSKDKKIQDWKSSS